jgi:glyoxylase-like metal-dependent hydrolase (beta-lactamase superfamily II)
MNTMQSGLKELGIDIRNTDFFITHLHSDHLGLVSSLATDNSAIYFSQLDADRFNSGIHWNDSFDFARMSGYPENELQAVRNLPRFRSKGNLVFRILKEGNTINTGDYVFKCFETPGHTKGHMSLYEPNKKIFVAGDHILNDISPNIQLWSDEWNPLKDYLRSLDKVYLFDIELVLPGHRSIIRNCKGRIRELKLHHQERLDDIISILDKGEKDAFQIASQMSWDILYDSWDMFPISQKWFATGETIAHLKYLEEKGTIRKEMREQRFIYSLN